MTERPKNNLLAETLAEASTPDFRAALLAETLRHARRRRHWRHARQAGGVLVLAILVAILSLQPRPVEKTPVAKPVAKVSAPQSYQSIETRPLAESAMIETTSFPAIKIISGQPAIVEIVTSRGNFKYIGDNELLALVGNYPVALVRTGPNSEELVFANPEDQKKLFGN